MYTCVFIYIYTYIYIYSCIHICIYTYIYMCVCECAYWIWNVFIYIYISWLIISSWWFCNDWFTDDDDDRILFIANKPSMVPVLITIPRPSGAKKCHQLVSNVRWQPNLRHNQKRKIKIIIEYRIISEWDDMMNNIFKYLNDMRVSTRNT